MSALRPKTIILSAQSVRPVPASISGDGTLILEQQTIADYDDEVLECGISPKRRRLTFLSPEEKLVRRKLKNRVAAQTARDRKKQQMTELEDALARLQAKNVKLTAENEALRQSSSQVVQENERLKQRLEMLTSEGASGNPCHVKCEPAVFDTPLPWERTWTAFQLAAFCVAFLAVLSLMHSSSSVSPSLSCSPSRKDAQTETGVAGCALQLMSGGQHHPPVKWWGRHQHSWNPAMN